MLKVVGYRADSGRVVRVVAPHGRGLDAPPPAPPGQTVAPVPTNARVVLEYRIDQTTTRYGMISLHNQNRFPWADIHMQIGDVRRHWPGSA